MLLPFAKFWNVSFRYFVLITTASRLYQFLGTINSSEDARPLLVNVFDSDATQLNKFLELPGSLRSPLSLALGYVTKERGRAFARTPLYPASFGWLTGSGIYYGRVDASFGEDTVTADCQLLQFPASSSKEGDDPVAPKGVLLTEFHALLAYDHSVRGICLLNQQVSFQLH